MICQFVDQVLIDKRNASDHLENTYLLTQSDVNQKDSSLTAAKTQTNCDLALPTRHALNCVLIDLVHHFQFALFYEKCLHSRQMQG